MPFVFVFALLLAVTQVAAQPCLTMQKTNARAAQSPAYSKGLRSLDSLYAVAEHMPAQRDDFQEVIIPIVVHVIFEDEQQNIPDSQIHAQIAALNRDFNWEQSDKHKIPDVWRDLGAATHFRFHLADKDPDGNFTHGITRKQTFTSEIGGTDDYYQSSRGGTDPWNQAHYVNVWVCAIGGKTLGFTYLPSNNPEPNDGIVIDPRAFGTGGTAKEPYTMGRTLVHEMGHYFGLRHPWGNATEEKDYGCTNTDYMSDTPWQYKPNFGCDVFPSVSCPSEPNGDMFMNFMDYSNDSCSLLFTKRQVGFMQLVLRTSKVTLTHSPAHTGVGSAAGETAIALWPNPSAGLFTVSLAGELPETYAVLNLLGETVLTGKPNAKTFEIGLSGKPAGMYFLKAGSAQKTVVLVSP